MKLHARSAIALLALGCGSESGGAQAPPVGPTSSAAASDTGAATSASLTTTLVPEPLSRPTEVGMPMPVQPRAPASNATSVAQGGTDAGAPLAGDSAEPVGERGGSGGGGPGAGQGGTEGEGFAGGSNGGTEPGGGGDGGGAGVDAGAGGEPRCAVQPLTDEFRRGYDDLDPFYTKYADAAGLPVVASDAPADLALTRACELVIDMTMREDVRQALRDNFVRFAIIGKDELTNDIPEFAYLPDSINERARGLGGLPAVSCAEESILCDRERDRWRGEGICVHEFAHTISMGGLFYADGSFERRLQDAFESAAANGLFANTYAMESAQEYWAEGVQDWYYTNLESDPPNGIHNHIDRREELLAYDPVLHALVEEFLPEPVQFVDCYSDE